MKTTNRSHTLVLRPISKKTPRKTDPLSLHLDQTSAQTFSGGTVTGTGLLKVTAGELGLDTTAYLPTWSAVADVVLSGFYTV